MTIAIGILTHDSAVIAADSEVSTDYESGQGNKVFGIMHWTQDAQNGAIAITGAGDAAYLDACFAEIIELFTHTSELKEFGKKLSIYLDEFYTKHVIPFAAYGERRPDVWLIIAAQRCDELNMWTTDRNLVRPVRGVYTAVGVGQMYGENLLRKYCGNRQQDAETSMAVAVYVIDRVKDRIRDCGKQTRMLCLKRGEVMPVGLSVLQIRELEQVFSDYEKIDSAL